MQRPSIQLLTPDTQAQINAIRLIFTEYAEQLGVDLCFQNFDVELANLPGEYASPRGALLLALIDGVVAGCCALRPRLSVDCRNAAEMKRLYVRSTYRGSGLGRQLAEATLDDMESARALYVDLGFTSIPPHYHNPIAGAHYPKVDL